MINNMINLKYKLIDSMVILISKINVKQNKKCKTIFFKLSFFFKLLFN